jgi:predicted nuclease of predicted toxin-antitoxin system
VKLLFDHNLSHKLVDRLADIYPGSTQTRVIGFGRATDAEIWFHARTHEFVIVSKDNDFGSWQFSAERRRRSSGYVSALQQRCSRTIAAA